MQLKTVDILGQMNDIS